MWLDKIFWRMHTICWIPLMFCVFIFYILTSHNKNSDSAVTTFPKYILVNLLEVTRMGWWADMILCNIDSPHNFALWHTSVPILPIYFWKCLCPIVRRHLMSLKIKIRVPTTYINLLFKRINKVFLHELVVIIYCDLSLSTV